MSVMKRANYLITHHRGELSKGFRVAFGLDPEPPSAEELARIRAEKKELAAAMREAAEERAEEREAIQWVEAYAERVREFGEPRAPQANTGFYRCGDMCSYWVGTGPFPEYRPPGLAWSRSWKQPKPADVPWADETPPPPLEAPPVPAENTKATQGRFAW